MIIAKLKGGLGNQMFQYAAGLALACRWNTSLKLDLSWYDEHPGLPPHNRYALSCFCLDEAFASADELYRVPVSKNAFTRLGSSAARRLGLERVVRRLNGIREWHCPSHPSIDPEFSRLGDDVGLDGYFQSERFLLPVSDLVRRRFAFRSAPSGSVAMWADKIRTRPSIALHFRRGDYASDSRNAREHGVVTLSYYHRALDLLRSRAPGGIVYVFSDDIGWVADEFRPGGCVEYVREDASWGAHEALRLMSLCDHIATANSSFSWWAAWLNANPAKQVVAPSPWFANPELESNDIVPATWIRIPRQE